MLEEQLTRTLSASSHLFYFVLMSFTPEENYSLLGGEQFEDIKECNCGIKPALCAER